MFRGIVMEGDTSTDPTAEEVFEDRTDEEEHSVQKI